MTTAPPWRQLPLWLLAIPTLIPVAASLTALLDIRSPHWPHLLQVVLPPVTITSLLLVALVSTGSAALGVSLAWLTARYRFLGHGMLHVALLLPLAMPGYVLGFVAISGLDYSGPLQSAWRTLSGHDQALWEIRSLGGAALTLILTLYPYVYLICHNAFSSLSASSIEVAASLGERRLFRKLALPLAGPWIVGAVLLVAMETLADFGTVSLFNVNTFTTTIYRTWYGLFALDAALQLASALILIALALMSWQRRVENRRRRQQDTARHLPAIPLRGLKGLLAGGSLLAFVLIVVGIPVATLCAWSAQHLADELDARYWVWLGNTLSIALFTAALLCASAAVLAVARHRQAGASLNSLRSVATLGYALPGTLIAVGLFAPLSWLEANLASWLAPGWMSQSLLVLLLGYWARFFNVAHTPLAAQLQRVSPHLDEASRGLGVTGWRQLRTVYLPLISPAIATAAALIVIDVIKEMPITLMTRPAGWNTLATRVFELTAEGEYQRAALPSLTIVLAGLVPIIILLRQGKRPLAGN